MKNGNTQDRLQENLEKLRSMYPNGIHNPGNNVEVRARQKEINKQVKEEAKKMS